MTTNDPFVPPSIEFVLGKRGQSLEDWLLEHQVNTPNDLQRVVDSLEGTLTISEGWRRRALVAVLDRLMTLPMSIGPAPVQVLPEVLVAEPDSSPEAGESPTAVRPPGGKRQSPRTSIRRGTPLPLAEDPILTPEADDKNSLPPESES